MKRVVCWMLLFVANMPGAAMALNPGTSPDHGGEACSAGFALPAGVTKHTIDVDGMSRDYQLHVPSTYSGEREVPLILDFHGIFMGPVLQRWVSNTDDLSEDQGIIVAYPDGIDNAWNVGPCCTESREIDDVAFAKAVVEDISARACINEKRVYAMGYSNGGGLSHYLACHAADTFAAVAPAAFDLLEENQEACDPVRPMPVYSYRGRTDPIVPYEGGESTPPTLTYDLDPIHFMGAQATFERWGEINNCSEPPADIGNGCMAYSGCDGDAEVVLCSDDSGHGTWDAYRAWDFLKNHQLP